MSSLTGFYSPIQTRLRERRPDRLRATIGVPVAQTVHSIRLYQLRTDCGIFPPAAIQVCVIASIASKYPANVLAQQRGSSISIPPAFNPVSVKAMATR